MIIEPFAVLLAALLSAGVGYFIDRVTLNPWLEQALRQMFGLTKKLTPDEETLEGRLARLSELMDQSGQLFTEVTAELKLRDIEAKRLQAEAKAAEEIVKLTAEQKEAVAQLVRTEVTSEGKRSTRLGLWTGLFYALAGALVTLAVTLYVHPAYLHDAPSPSTTASQNSVKPSPTASPSLSPPTPTPSVSH